MASDRDRGTERDAFGREFRLAQIGSDKPLEPGTTPPVERLRVYRESAWKITAQDALALARVARRYDEPIALAPGYVRDAEHGGGEGWAVVAPDGKAFVVEDGEVWAEA